MDNPHYLDAVRQSSIKNDVITLGGTSEIWLDLITFPTCTGKLCNIHTPLFEPEDKCDGGINIVLRYVISNV